ncbi:MAG TPA: helix-turn-helix domain-containing protein [Acidimicrobiales bacterium]|nr:helix-turn-helix domain-containing protein [Acidimicrobiales bacterium]
MFKSTGARKPTKWGDRAQRRTDILDAARTRIAEHGYLALNMRDLAADAGVSPATLYSYFATKEELFATLYAEAIRQHTEAFRPLADGNHRLAPLLAKVLEGYLDLWRTYGRHFTLWSAIRRDVDPEQGPFPRELIDELRSATVAHNKVLMESVREAAARDDRRVVDAKLVPAFLWATLNGLADHVVSERRGLDPFPARRLIDFAGRRLAVAITEEIEETE